MDKIFKIKIISLIGFAVLCGAFLFGNLAGAEGSPDFEIIPERNPLFEENNFLPGKKAFGGVLFLNSSSSIQTITFKMANYEDYGNPLFGDVLFIEAKDGDSVILAPISLTDFAVLPSSQLPSFELLSGDPPPNSKTVDFIVSFDKEAYDEYNIIEENAGKEMKTSFDLEFTAVWDGGESTGMVAGAAVAELQKETILQKIGRVLGAATETGASILFIFLASLLLAFLVYFNSKKTKKNSGKI